ncbi:MAG: MFS transporter [Turicibacter sp.]|nr:MFS transporter [Turicibacter sp.]
MKKSKDLLSVGMLYQTANAIAGMFVNVFLIQVTNDLGLIIMQNILFAASLLGAFLLGSKLLAKVDIIKILRFGVLSNMLYFLIILILQENTAPFLIPLGLFNGVGQGFFWFSYNILLGRLLTDDERGKFFGVKQSFENLFGIVTPMVAGFVITRFSELTGYYVLFGTSVIMFIFGILLSSRIQTFTSDEKMNFLPILKLRGNKYWNSQLFLNTTMGMSTMIHNQIFIVFAFHILRNEQRMGNYNSLIAVVGVLSSMWLARNLTSKNEKKLSIISASVFMLGLTGLGVFANEVAYAVAAVAVGFSLSWNMSIGQSMKYKLSTLGGDGFSQDEYIIAAEFPTALGRILGLGIALGAALILEEQLAYRLLMILNGSLWLINYVAIQKQVGWLQDSPPKSRLRQKPLKG